MFNPVRYSLVAGRTLNTSQFLEHENKGANKQKKGNIGEHRTGQNRTTADKKKKGIFNFFKKGTHLTVIITPRKGLV